MGQSVGCLLQRSSNDSCTDKFARAGFMRVSWLTPSQRVFVKTQNLGSERYRDSALRCTYVKRTYKQMSGYHGFYEDFI